MVYKMHGAHTSEDVVAWLVDPDQTDQTWKCTDTWNLFDSVSPVKYAKTTSSIELIVGGGAGD